MQQLICENLSKIQHQIELQCVASQRPAGGVSLLAVSKTKPTESIRAAYACGQREFGENYAQELAEKARILHDLSIHWHFIGPLQSNKTRLVAENAHWVHSIEREKIARRLSEQRPPSLPDLQVCIQVNVDEEETKSGVSMIDVPDLAQAISEMPRLQLRGLMCIPSRTSSDTQLKKSFSLVQASLDALKAKGFPLDTLSMGMSHDYPLAIAEGATILRIGTAIFGARE
ncbi:MAG: YggS family pyridoxal phosphate-dependent enzyme [bacterium]